MKALLMYRDRDFDLQRELPWNGGDLTKDLELDMLFGGMAGGDSFLFDVAKRAVLCSLKDTDTILYRQHILSDCLDNPLIVRSIYDLAVEAIANEKRNYWGISSGYPDSILYRSREVLQMFVGMLRRLRAIADEHADKFQSEGFTRFFQMLGTELSDEYIAGVQAHLKEMKFRRGVLISADLGQGNRGTNYVLRKPHDKRGGWVEQITERIVGDGIPSYTYCVPDRDESGSRALSELKDRGLNLVANALAQSNDHILSFFKMLRTELAFYVGCLNLQGQLARKGEPLCFPVPTLAGERRHAFTGLYDVCLSLRLPQRVVGNDVDADGSDLVIVTGANQGGKSTFLRSIGLSQLMMQCGMFVGAASFCANLCEGLFTHYKREEDAAMESGKLDEELSRMSDMADHLSPNCMALFNESFAATNEREGSEIARQIVCALLEKGIEVFFVTHLYQFAHSFYNSQLRSAVFLRAQRELDGSRTFRLVEGEPLEASYGEDVYHKIFEGDLPSAVRLETTD
ncbi:MAG: DNA mismatch repair protein MutS [Chloroflexota bacterium]